MPTKRALKCIQQKHTDIWQKLVSNPLLSIYSDPKFKNKTRNPKKSNITDEAELIEYAKFFILKVQISFSFIK